MSLLVRRSALQLELHISKDMGSSKDKRRIKTIKKINPRMHFERRYGTQKEAIAYCKKDGSYEERGEMNHQGERVDLH